MARDGDYNIVVTGKRQYLEVRVKRRLNYTKIFTACRSLNVYKKQVFCDSVNERGYISSRI